MDTNKGVEGDPACLDMLSDCLTVKNNNILKVSLVTGVGLGQRTGKSNTGKM